MIKPTPLIIFLHDLKDPRARPNAAEHKFIDILIIAICAIMSGAETWEDIESYGRDKEDWLIGATSWYSITRQFLPNILRP